MASAEEMSFLAGEQPITIVPKGRIDSLDLICGTIEELRPAIPAEVPFWLAMYLKKRDKCRVQIPSWLEPENLESTLESERSGRNKDEFAQIDFHYIEMSKQLLTTAADDIPDAHRIRALIADIEDHRRAKMQRGMQNFDQHASTVSLDNISAMELHCIRSISTGALDCIHDLNSSHTRAAGGTAPSQQPPPPPPADAGPSKRLASALRRRSAMA